MCNCTCKRSYHHSYMFVSAHTHPVALQASLPNTPRPSRPTSPTHSTHSMHSMHSSGGAGTWDEQHMDEWDEYEGSGSDHGAGQAENYTGCVEPEGSWDGLSPSNKCALQSLLLHDAGNRDAARALGVLSCL